MTSRATVDLGWKDTLQLPSIRLFLTGYVLDAVGDLVWFVSLGWLAARSHGGVGAGVIPFLGAAPAAALMLFGGALVDRWTPGRTVMVTTSVRTVLLLGWCAAILAGVPLVVALPVAALSLGALDGLHRPALDTWSTLLAPAEAQTTMAGLERMAGRFAQVVGGFAGGWLLESWAGAAGLVTAVLLAGALMVFRRLKVGHTVPLATVSGPAESVWGSVRGGWSLVRSHQALRRTMPVHGLFNAITAGMTLTALPLRATERGWSAGSFGLIYGSWGVGLAIGTVALLRGLQRRGRRVRLALMLVGASGALCACLGVASRPWTTAVAAGVFGACCGAIGPILTGFARDAARRATNTGAVLGVQSFALDGLEPLGYLLAGVLVSSLGTSKAFMLAGAAIVVLSGYALSSRAVRSARS